MADPASVPVSVHLLPDLIPEGGLVGGLAIVVDVLRATTVMVRALASGASAVLPCLEIEEARARAAEIGPDRAVLAGERDGVPIPGFDLGNSPRDFDEATVGGKTVVMTTTNGTRAILASRGANRILIAAFSNLAATRREAVGGGLAVHVVCSGTDRLVSFEDTLMAGAVVRDLVGAGFLPGNDSARIALACLEHRVGNLGETPDPTDLAAILAEGKGGRRVESLGLGADLVDSARIDQFGLVAEYRPADGLVRSTHSSANREG